MIDRRHGAAALIALAMTAGAGCSDGERAVPTQIPEPVSSPSPSAYERPAVRFEDRVVSVELADEPSERRRGLMFRTRLARDDGMLFVFSSPTQTGFWMKNTRIPLSIAFLRHVRGARFEVVAILDMEPCRLADTTKCPRHRPGVPYDAALEVNQGWFDDAGVAVGAEAVYEPAR